MTSHKRRGVSYFRQLDCSVCQRRRYQSYALTHWGRVTHICVSKRTIIGSDNGLSPDRRQAIIWINAGILLTATLGTNCSEILIEILSVSFKKMRLKVSSAKRRPFCLGLNVLMGFERRNPPVISGIPHHKRPAKRKSFPCHYVSMYHLHASIIHNNLPHLTKADLANHVFFMTHATDLREISG